MKNSLKIRSAFSLIELSIVILIIGILIAGVTQSSRLIAKSRLSNAKALTQSAPVASIKDLALWVETTSDDSFDDADTESAAAVTNWYDINPQVSVKSSLVGATTARPLYTTLSTGNVSSLPTLLFDGTDFMTSANFGNIQTASTVFLVLKTPSTIVAGVPIFDKRTAAGADSTTNIAVNMGSATTGWQYCDGYSCVAPASGAAMTASTAYVVSITYLYTAGTAAVTTFYKNGTIINAAVSTALSTGPNTSASGSLLVGKANKSTPTFFGDASNGSGYIGELIIYSRALKAEERKSVEQYLGKKWGLAVAA